MARSRYIVGIDLGTTNCALAYVDTQGRDRPSADIKTFAIPQLVAAGETAPRPMLPSFLYLPGQHELPPGAAALPWTDDNDRIVGEFARVQGGRVPAHLVTSAKSWLCHPGVDREADILPWGSPTEARRVSPVEASADYLRHLRDAWDVTFALEDPDALMERQEVVLTVPASFDEAARELTVEAARRAGLANVTLLEEPQAAFYCWIVTHQDGWQKQVRGGELILVCDIGGGTSDFSLITVIETPTGPGFRRVAVGDHLMLGGDNMDLALAHRVESKLGNVRLDADQWNSLRLACRTAKEKLWGENSPGRWPVTVAGRGSKLIGGSLQSELTRDDVRDLVLDGFFPRSRRDEAPDRGSKAGLQEFGLPFVADPAITKHLSSFLRRHRADAPGESGKSDDRPARPDAILFNGGALTPDFVRQRIVDVVGSWFSNESEGTYSPRVLANASLDLAVAIGAAYYGVVRRGGGIRIGGGTARGFYIGFEAQATDKPWLCVVPRDAQEGDEIEVKGHDFDLLMGQPVAFPLASSSVRASDQPGDLVASDPDSILPLPPLVGHMRVGRKAKAERVPVRLAARVTEIGTIELWCHSRGDDRRWRLQIQLRGPGGQPSSTSTAITGGEADAVVIEQSELDRAIDDVKVAFATHAPEDERGPSRLIKRLEESLDVPRDQWPPSALRALWEPLRAAIEDRSKSPRHESRWLNLAGYSLRPGTGFPLDENRIKVLWPVFHAGVKFTKDLQCWAEWWILWRRVAAGLNRAHHDEIARRIAPFLSPPKGGGGGGKKPTRPKPEPHELAEMWRCMAGLERISASQKEPLGDQLIRDLGKPNPPAYALWCLGRFGARVPLFGPANTVVSREKAEAWLARLVERAYATDRETTDGIFALSQLARVSGDRARDVGPELRERVAGLLTRMGADEAQVGPVREFQEMGASQQGQALGDSLPVGLRLIAAEIPT